MGNLKILQPEEVAVRYVIPAVKRELSVALKKTGREQKEIAKLLGVTDASISFYLAGKRGAESLPNDIVEQIHNSAAEITDAKSAYIVTQKMMKLAAESGFLCKLHMKFDPSIAKNCTLCFEGTHGIR